MFRSVRGWPFPRKQARTDPLLHPPPPLRSPCLPSHTPYPKRYVYTLRPTNRILLRRPVPGAVLAQGGEGPLRGLDRRHRAQLGLDLCGGAGPWDGRESHKRQRRQSRMDFCWARDSKMNWTELRENFIIFYNWWFQMNWTCT